MRKSDILKLLADAPDDAILLVGGDDHSLRECRLVVGTALQEARNQWTEDHGEDVTPEAEYGKRINAIIVE
jgi:hypothetical protein